MSVIKKSTILLFLLLLTMMCKAKKPEFYPANDRNINYLGRVDFSPSKYVKYDWPAVQVRFRFCGCKFGIKFKGGERNYFNLFVDGELKKIVHSPNDTTIIIDNLSPNTTHEVVFFKRTEGRMGEANFYGIDLFENGRLLPWPDHKRRKIAFIGNSITCGYGVESANKTDAFLPETENAYKSYAGILSRIFDADYQITAHSGLGVIRNYGDTAKISQHMQPMPQRFNRTMDMQDSLLWDFSKWQADAAIVNLGTNDYSTTPHPDAAVFQNGYRNLITDVRSKYGAIPIFCIAGPLIDEPCYSLVKGVVEGFKTRQNDDNIFFIGIPKKLLNNHNDLGADSHPSYKGQKKIATHIEPIMANVMKWPSKN